MAQKRSLFIPHNSSEIQEKFINYVMKDGKKSTARTIFKNMIKTLEERNKGGKNPLEIFDLAIQNAMPNVEIRAKRMGGSVYQVPHEVPEKRRLTLAIRWIVQSCAKSSGKPMHLRLADEIQQASEMMGNAVKKKEDVHRMAQANKAFAHLAKY
ncbi:30S ribosomal protein S7 [Candidatus Peregrinibacteria bacterium]|nr:30S ribosomal protein S7 [Candidatus Peregrinibacteria bacterium]